MSDKPQLVTSTGPFEDIIILGHISAEDFDKEAGKVGACVEEADMNVIYRDTLIVLQDKAGPLFNKLAPGIPIGVNEKATAKAQERENAAATKAGRAPKTLSIPETFKSWANRIKLGVDEATWKEIDTEFRALALATPVDATPNVRTSNLANKADLAKADDILTRDEDAIEAAVTKLQAPLATEFDLIRDESGKPERVSLAKLVSAYVASQKSAI